MGEVSTIGLDIAKSVFQVHGRPRCSKREMLGTFQVPTKALTRELREDAPGRGELRM